MYIYIYKHACKFIVFLNNNTVMLYKYVILNVYINMYFFL